MLKNINFAHLRKDVSFSHIGLFTLKNSISPWDVAVQRRLNIGGIQFGKSSYPNIDSAIRCILMASPSDPARRQACLKVVGFTEFPSENTKFGITEEADICASDIKKVIHRC